MTDFAGVPRPVQYPEYYGRSASLPESIYKTYEQTLLGSTRRNGNIRNDYFSASPCPFDHVAFRSLQLFSQCSLTQPLLCLRKFAAIWMQKKWYSPHDLVSSRLPIGKAVELFDSRIFSQVLQVDIGSPSDSQRTPFMLPHSSRTGTHASCTCWPQCPPTR